MPCVMMRLACFRHVACSACLIMHAYFTSLAPAQRLGRCDRRVQGASVSIQGSAPDSGSQLCQLWRSLEPELRSRSFTHSSSTVRCTCRRGSRTSGAGICSVGRSWLTSSAGNLHADIRGSSSKPAAGSRVPIRQARVRRSHRQVFMLLKCPPGGTDASATWMTQPPNHYSGKAPGHGAVLRATSSTCMTTGRTGTGSRSLPARSQPLQPELGL